MTKFYSRFLLQIFDDKNVRLAKLCGYAIPSPIFTKSNKLSLVTSQKGSGYFSSNYDVYYSTTNKSSGCGGNFYNFVGTFTSPNYPETYKRDDVCIFNVEGPTNLEMAFRFNVFDLSTDCGTNYLEITTYNGNEPNYRQFCGKVSGK